MTRVRTIVCCALPILAVTTLVFTTTPARVPVSASRVAAHASYSEVADRVGYLNATRPLSFEPNQGQTDRRVKFLARGNHYQVFITPDRTVFALEGSKKTRPVVGLELVGARTEPAMEPIDPLPGHVNYFLGSDPAKWQIDVPIYGKVIERNVWPGIDLAFYG